MIRKIGLMALAATFAVATVISEDSLAVPGKVEVGEGTWNVNNEKTNPVVGNPKAPKGGTFVYGALSYPKSLNFLVSGDVASDIIFEMVVEQMCDINKSTGVFVPILAEKWHISKDQKEFTFYLNKKAKFADGKPVTTKDVKAFWDIIQNPKNLVGRVRSRFSKISDVKILDDHTFKVFAKEPHFHAMAIACEIMALDHTFYLKGDFNKKFNNKIKGSGPYIVSKVKKGHEIHLKRNKDYWGADLPQNIGRWNFDKYISKKIKDLNIRYELFKKGEIDGFYFNVAKRWKTETDGDKYKKNWIIARRVDNSVPKGFSGQILNTRNPLMKDKKVRKALAHAYNRERFIKELFYDNYVRLNSYFPNSKFANPNNGMIDFDLKKSRELLKEAGWTKVNDKGILTKDGKAFSIKYLYTDKSSERYLTIYKADLKKIGVELRLEKITWPTLVKKWNDYKFDTAGVQWSSELEPDPTDLWHSEFANLPSGQNLPGFSTPELDKLIESIRPIYDADKRAKVFHKIDKIIFDNHPYILGWFLDHHRLGYWNKFGLIDGGLPKYARADRMHEYMWFDKEKDKALKLAMKKDEALPKPAGIKGPQD